MIEQVQKIVPPAMKLDGAPSRIMTGWILVYNPQHGLIQLGPPGRRVTWNGEDKLCVHPVAAEAATALQISEKLIACTGWAAKSLPATSSGGLRLEFTQQQITISPGWEVTIASSGDPMFRVAETTYKLLGIDFVRTVAALTGHAVTYQPHKPGKPLAFRFTS